MQNKEIKKSVKAKHKTFKCPIHHKMLNLLFIVNTVSVENVIGGFNYRCGGTGCPPGLGLGTSPRLGFEGLKLVGLVELVGSRVSFATHRPKPKSVTGRNWLEMALD
jgi:hypothetical protein